MKRSPRVRLSAAVKRLSLRLSILALALLLLGSTALATTPIAVDLYQDMESGNAGDVLTSTIMNASSHGTSGWSAASGTMWVATSYHRDLPGPVIVGGTTYNGTGGSRSWTFKDDNQTNFVRCSLSGHLEITMAAYYTTSSTLQSQVGYDVMIMPGAPFACMSQFGGPLLCPHSSLASGISTGRGLFIPISAGKTYWVNMKYDGSVGEVLLAAFDPDNGYSLVGSKICQSTWGGLVGGDNWFGRGDVHGNQSNDQTYSYFDQIMLDWTNAAFPLLPGGANDTTAPGAPPVVRDGTAQDQSIALSTTQLSANWDMAWDAESGIKAYQYAIGTTPGATNVTNWTTLINRLGITKTGLSLSTGQTYYFSVKAQNGVGMWGPATNSNGQTVGTDTTPPSAPPAVRDGGPYGSNPDIDNTPSGSGVLYANFDPASDSESGISCYQFGFGTTLGATDFVGWTTINANETNAWAQHVTLTPRQRYYCTVRAINNAGLTGPATNSDGQIAIDSTDTTPPSAPPVVRDGTGTDIATQTSTTQLSANWDNSTDNESGINSYYYAIGTSPGGTNIVNDLIINHDSPVSYVTVTGLSLSVGQTYYFRIKATNGNFITGPATNSNGVQVVSGGNNPPTAPANVRDGTGADIAYTTSTTQLSANWDASSDSDGTVTAYLYAIGTSAGATNTVNWTTLGNVTTVTKTGLSLTNGQTYYFSVKAQDNQGAQSSATNSNGQKVDSTAPSAPATVRDGTGSDISTTASTTQLSANWDASSDGESGIAGYQYAIGTTAGGTQTVNWTSLGNVLTVTQSGLTLTVGQTYYVGVRAVNGAGLTGSATNSNGQTVVSGGGAVVYFSDNFESWTVHGGAWSSVSGELSTQTLNTSVDYAKAGAKGLKLTDTDTTSAYGACLTKTFSPVISGAIYVRFFVYLPTGYTTANQNAAPRRLLRVLCSGQRGQMSLTQGAKPMMEEIGGWSGTTATSNLSENAWHCIEMYMATPSASTAMQYWVDGTSAGTLTGNFSGATSYDHIEFGDVTFGSGTKVTSTFYLDEIVVSNSYVGTGITSPVTYFSDNFESWTVHGGAWSSVSGETSTHTLNTSTDQARSGTKSLKLTDTDTTATAGAYVRKNFSPTIGGDVYVRFYVFFPTGYGSTNNGCRRRFLRVLTGGQRGQMSFHAYPSITPIMEEIGGWTSASGSAISENQWHCIEMHMTTPGATTLLEFWIDGALNSTALLANFSSGSGAWDYMELGDVVLGNSTNPANTTFYIDETIVSNSYIGPLP
jgi:hypothetical protein